MNKLLNRSPLQVRIKWLVFLNNLEIKRRLNNSKKILNDKECDQIGIGNDCKTKSAKRWRDN